MMKTLIAAKVARMDDETLKEAIAYWKKLGWNIPDWRNWGDNIERLMAEEAHRRGLLP